MWVKPLAGGARAVALLNRGATAIQIRTTARAIGISRAARYRVQNLWAHKSFTTTGEISGRVSPHAAMLYRVTRA